MLRPNSQRPRQARCSAILPAVLLSGLIALTSCTLPAQQTDTWASTQRKFLARPENHFLQKDEQTFSDWEWAMQTYTDQEVAKGRTPTDWEMLQGGRDLLARELNIVRSAVQASTAAHDEAVAQPALQRQVEAAWYQDAPARPPRPVSAPTLGRTELAPQEVADWAPAPPPAVVLPISQVAQPHTDQLWKPAPIDAPALPEQPTQYVDTRGRPVANPMPAGPNGYWNEQGQYRQTFDRGDGVQQTFRNSRTPIEAFNEAGAAFDH